MVTPYAGVWIETWDMESPEDAVIVTPYAGVWIETGFSWQFPRFHTCHSLRGSVD